MMSDFVTWKILVFDFFDCDRWLHQFEDYVEKIEIIQQFQNTRASS
jgi:hypothetical protein